MRSTCSLYVDVGYLLASAATRVTGTSFRNGIHVEFRRLIGSLVAEAEDRSGLPLLRVHWYDSAREGVPDPQQERIGELSRVKLRLGRFSVDRQQKGVDLRIGLDLVAHARNGAASVFFLVSGDDDLTEAVEEAQVHGVQVILLAVPTKNGKPHGVNRHLVRASDELAVLPAELIDSTVMRVETPRTPTTSPAEQAQGSVLAEHTSAPPDATSPAVPTPRDLAAMSRPVSAVPSSVLAYQGTSGGPSQVMPGYDEPETYDSQIDGVVSKVLKAFRQSASPDDISELRHAKPSIPRDIDRALLVDLSETLELDDLSDPIRHRLRERFWEQCG